MIHRVKEGEIKNLRGLARLAEEHDMLIIERGENEPGLVVVLDQKFLQILSCTSFLTDNGFLVTPTSWERIVKGG